MSSPRSHFVLCFPRKHRLLEYHPALEFADYPSCDFRPGKKYPFRLDPQTRKIRLKEVLHCGGNSTVYAGLCRDGTEVALKFTTDYQDVIEEASFYDYVEDV